MDNLPLVSADDLARDIDHYQDLASVQPVYVGRDGRAETVMISVAEYGRLRRRQRQAFAAGELPEAMLNAVEQVEMDARHDHLDRLLEDGGA